MKPEFRNVVDVIVKNDMCIGCGLCTGVCPVQVLRMDFNELGEYVPDEFKPGCLPNCNLCLDVCPFWDRNKDEDQLGEELFQPEPEIAHTPETGFYLEAFAGYSTVDSQRENGSSGGLATWVLETLLCENIVDKVICVGANPDPDQLFKFKVCSTVQEVRESSRSCYYPVELSEVIRYILENEGRYALTGVPCYIKGLRLAMNRFPKLQRRIVFLCGLVCAQTQSKLFLEQLVRMKGGDPKSISSATFRIKDMEKPANNYGFHFTCGSGDVNEGSIFFKEGMGELWLNGYFTPNACHHCDDVFAETADITFMDAWLPQYQSDPRGHNLILVRSKLALDIIRKGIQTEALAVEPIDVGSIIRSQAGGIVRKRAILQRRLTVEKRTVGDGYLPRKRVKNAPGLVIEEKLLFALRERLRKKYRERYLQDHSYSPQALDLRIVRSLIFLVSKSSFFLKRIRKGIRLVQGKQSAAPQQDEMSHG